MRAFNWKQGHVFMPLFATAAVIGVYLFNPQFAITVNGICEMLYSGGDRGLMMYYHDAGPNSGWTAIGASVLTVLVPAIKPQYLWMANTGYFGSVMGALLTTLGVVLALTFLFAWGKLMVQPFKRASFQKPKWFQLTWMVMGLFVASRYWPGWMALALGIWNPLDKK